MGDIEFIWGDQRWFYRINWAGGIHRFFKKIFVLIYKNRMNQLICILSLYLMSKSWDGVRSGQRFTWETCKRERPVKGKEMKQDQGEEPSIRSPPVQVWQSSCHPTIEWVVLLYVAQSFAGDRNGGEEMNRMWPELESWNELKFNNGWLAVHLAVGQWVLSWREIWPVWLLHTIGCQLNPN